jgi:hypothetical protein
MENNMNEDQDLLDNDEMDGENQSAKKTRVVPIWIISILLHSIAIAALTWFIIEKAKPKTELIMITEIKEKIDPLIESIKDPVFIKNKPDTPIVKDVVLPPQETQDEVTDKSETPNDENKELAEGVEIGKSDSPLTGAAFTGTIGSGSLSAGKFGTRTGGKKYSMTKNGGSPQTEGGVKRALWWLANHQEPDGHWDSGKYEGNGTPEVDSACTGAALLTFLGSGYTDRAGEYKKNVGSAVKWLLSAQKPNGSWDQRNYANGICTMAIAEAAGMGVGGTEVKKSAELAVDYLLKQQNASGCFDYSGPTNRDDMSVTGWCIMGLKSALLANIKEKEITEAFKKCGAFFDKTEGTNDNTSTSKGLAWYTPGTTGSGAPAGACQAIAMLIRQYLGWERSSPWLTAASDGQITKIPAVYESADVYRIYYSFLTLFQQGGANWKAWNEPVSKMIVNAQRQDGDFKGSWNPNNTSHMEKGGRVLFTAFLCLSLEIYYRYETIIKQH